METDVEPSKRKRHPPGFHARRKDDDAEDDSDTHAPRSSLLPKAKLAAAQVPKAKKKRGRNKGFFPHESTGPSSKKSSDVVVPEDVDLSPGTMPGSAEVKIMNLTASQNNERSPDKRPYWGGEINVTVHELLAIHHSLPEDNTDMLVLCARDPLLGDIYVFKHLINRLHDYHFNCRTFRVLDPRPEMIEGENPPGRHRDVAVLQAWIEHLTTWTGGPPILIMHFHGGDEDQQLDEERPIVPLGVRIVRGIGVGDTAPAGGERTHAFVRKRLKKYVLPRIRSEPIIAFDSGDWLQRMQAFERCFLDTGSNVAFGELGCAIAEDALHANGALATLRHPDTNHHFDLLFSY